MAALNSYDAILAALEAGAGQEVMFSKTAPSATVLGAFHSSWAYTGYPGVGAWAGAGGSTAATMVTCDSGTVGGMPIASPSTASAKNLRILTAGAMPSAALAGTAILIDRIADSGSLTTASGGSCTVTMPGGSVWARYPTGVGVMAFVESLTGTPTNGANVALAYTNSDSVASRTSGTAGVVNAIHRAFGTSGPFISLQGTDKGIKSIESINLTTAAALNIAVVVCKPLLMIPVTTAYSYVERDLVIQTPKLPKLPVTADATSCLQWIFLAGAAVTPTVTGSLSFVEA